MKGSFRTFYALSLFFYGMALFFVPSLSSATEEPHSVELSGCLIRLALPEGFHLLAKDEGNFLVRGEKIGGASPVVLGGGCRENPYRTDLVSRMGPGTGKTGERKEGERSEFELKNGIRAVVFRGRVVREGRRLEAAKGYFFTRNHIYVFLTYSEGGYREELIPFLRNTMEEIRFTSPVEKTIPEDRYRFRLTVLLGGVLLLFVILSIYLVRKLIFKRKRAP